MPSSIAAAATTGHLVPVIAPLPAAVTPAKALTAKAVVQPSPVAVAGSTAQQQAALNRLLATYVRDQSRGVDPGLLSSLGKQIMAAAKTAGQHVTLPHARASSGGTSASRPVIASSAKGKINVTA
jgi:hypothetical protein